MSLTLAGLRAEKLLEFILDALPLIGIRRRVALARDVGPRRRILTVDVEPFLGDRLAIRHDRLGGAFGLAHAAIDALVGMDDEHILAFVEAIDRTDLDTIQVLALDAGFGDDIGHDSQIFRQYERPRRRGRSG